MSMEEMQAAEIRFGACVRRMRKARGWSQAEMARRMRAAGVPANQSTVSRIERGQAATIGSIVTIAASFGVPPWELFPDGNRPPAVAADVVRDALAVVQAIHDHETDDLDFLLAQCTAPGPLIYALGKMADQGARSTALALGVTFADVLGSIRAVTFEDESG